MRSFDDFSYQLFNEAKWFFEQAKQANADSLHEQCTAYQHASIMVGMSFLESYVNAICDEFLERSEFSLLEKSLMSERNFVFKDGQFDLSNQLKMYRLIDRIEFLYRKFSNKPAEKKDAWFTNIKQSISIRNELVHPKEVIDLTNNKVESFLQSILDTANVLCKAIYKKQLPIYRSGLNSNM